MAEDNNAPAAGAAGQDTPPPLIVKAQYIKDFSFENPGAPGIIGRLRQMPQVSIDVTVDTNLIEGTDWEVVLNMKIDANHEGETVFIAELSYGGVFGVGPQVPEESVQPLLSIECARILFPFARKILAEATHDGGVPPLALQPIDFIALYRNKYGNPNAAGAAGTA